MKLHIDPKKSYQNGMRWLAISLIFIIFLGGCVLRSDNDQQEIHYDDVLKFWFGPLEKPEDFPKERLSLWFMESDAVDQEMRDRYSSWVDWAASGKLDHWKEDPRGKLALIILLDQLPRHIYRDTPQAYRYDPLARKVVFEGIAKGDDEALLPVEKMFFYLPMQHAENTDLQNFSVALYEQLAETAPAPIKENMQKVYQHAKHQESVIARFNRFPHRNVAMNRESTSKEEQYLKYPPQTLSFQ